MKKSLSVLIVCCSVLFFGPNLLAGEKGLCGGCGYKKDSSQCSLAAKAPKCACNAPKGSPACKAACGAKKGDKSLCKDCGYPAGSEACKISSESKNCGCGAKKGSPACKTKCAK